MKIFVLMLFAATTSAVAAPEPADPKLVATLYVVKATLEPKKPLTVMRWEWHNTLPQACRLGVSRTEQFQLDCGELLIPAEGHLADLPVTPNRFTITGRDKRVYINY